MYVPTIQGVFPYLPNNLLNNKKGNILYPVCIINMLRVVERIISAQQIVFRRECPSMSLNWPLRVDGDL